MKANNHIVIEYRRPGYAVIRFAIRFQPQDWRAAMWEVCHVYAQGSITYRDAQSLQRRITAAVLKYRGEVRA